MRILLATIALCATAPQLWAQDLSDQFPPIAGDIPIDECSNCLTDGSVTLTYAWTWDTQNFSASNGVPSGARVKDVYLAWLPTGQNILIDLITLTQSGYPVSLALFYTYQDGTIAWVSPTRRDTQTFGGHPVNPVDASHWIVTPRVRAADPSSTLQVTVVIDYTFDTPPTPPPPTVTRLSLGYGDTDGTTNDFIQGTNFAPGGTVTFGGVPATRVDFLSDRLLEVVAPPHAPGPVTVAVTVNGQTGSLANAYTYYRRPTITAISPSSGPNQGGSWVTITGTDFATNPQFPVTVRFGGPSSEGRFATEITVLSATTIRARTPAHAKGPVELMVMCNGLSTYRANAFTYYSSEEIMSVVNTLLR